VQVYINQEVPLAVIFLETWNQHRHILTNIEFLNHAHCLILLLNPTAGFISWINFKGWFLKNGYMTKFF